ncbi:MAG: pilus assembly protein PilM [Planctomycetes bacterium]|nr:pilus assembly protein PilM [Planctomycetota bacterium]
MAKSCGLRIGPRRFELFVLDGNPKKPKVVSSLAGEIPFDADDPVGTAAAALRQAIKTHKIATENVSVAIDAKVAAFRRLNLPMKDSATIESVLKFEVESQLPQFNIDDVVVDFYQQEVVGESSSLLVTAVPKAEISRTLALCKKAGFEPLEIETEATAIVNAAVGAGFCAIDNAQVVVHVGEESTAVAVIDGGRVREMRTIQVGALTYTPLGGELPELPEETEDEFTEDGGAAEVAPSTSAGAGLLTIEREDELVSRLLRELARTVSASRTANELQAIYVCGFELRGLVGADVLGVPVKSFGTFQADTTEGRVHREYASCAVAYGTALRQLGGGAMKASLRREELKFTGAFERLELPLAVMCLLLVTLLGFWNIFLRNERQALEGDLVFMLKSTINYMISDPKKGKAGSLAYPPKILEDYIKNTASVEPGSDPEVFRKDPGRNRYEQLVQIRSLLRAEQKRLSKELGQDTEITQPQSAFKAMTLVLDTLFDGGKNTFGRVSLRKIDSVYQSRAGKDDKVVVTIAAVFYSDTDSTTEATRNYEAFYARLREQPWYVEDKPSGSETVKGVETGIYLPNLSVTVDTTKAPEVKS